MPFRLLYTPERCTGPPHTRPPCPRVGHTCRSVTWTEAQADLRPLPVRAARARLRRNRPRSALAKRASFPLVLISRWMEAESVAAGVLPLVFQVPVLRTAATISGQDMGVRRIIRHLEGEGIKPKNGGRWHPKVVIEICRRR